MLEDLFPSKESESKFTLKCGNIKANTPDFHLKSLRHVLLVDVLNSMHSIFVSEWIQLMFLKMFTKVWNYCPWWKDSLISPASNWLGRSVGLLEIRKETPLQRHPERLDRWPAVRNSTRPSAGSCPWVTINPGSTLGWGKCLERCPAEKDMEVLVKSSWTWASSAHMDKKANPGLYEK